MRRLLTGLLPLLLTASCGGDSPPASIDATPGEDVATPDAGPPPCVDDDGDGFGEGCAAGADCDDADPAANPSGAETCDGVDNDCDGATDEDLAPPSCELTLGVCAGATAICGGAGGWRMCDAADYGADYEAAETRCDGLDNDCDGNPDETCACVVGSPPRACGSDAGECVAGTQDCLLGAWGPCEGDVEPTAESCNGLDDDCDGESDEAGDLDAPDCPLQLGVCAGAEASCGGSFGWLPCTSASYGPAYETIEASCDGVDNDCDGNPDETCECVVGAPPQSCGTDVGACELGAQVCTPGGWGACAGGVDPATETCDGVDEDCDGVPDDGLAGADCPLQVGVCAGATQACGGAAGWLPCDGSATYGPLYQLAETTCDGFDNDCDGVTDEGCPCVVGSPPLPCGTDVGACEPGTQSCTPTGYGPCTGGVGPVTEDCNGLDDDCDGVTDDGLTPPACPLSGGVCAGATQTCGGAAGWLACGPASYGPSYVATEDGTIEAQCDALDNDCDAITDESCLSVPIVTGASDQVLPSIYHAYVAYLAHDGVSWDVYLSDLRSGASERLTTTPEDEGAPDVYGNLVVFSRGATSAVPSGASSRIVVFDLATGTESVITAAQSERPRVWRDLVVWQDGRSGTSWDLYLRQLSTGLEIPLLTSPAHELLPDLRNARVVYVTTASGVERVRVLDLVTGADVEQSAGGSAQLVPAADWFFFAWSDDGSGTLDAFAAEYAAPATVDVLANTAGDQLLGGADARLFVWSDNASGDWDVAVSAVGGAALAVTSGPSHQGDPAISGGVIVFEDNRLGTFDLYAAALNGVPATGAGWLRINEVLADPAAADDVNGDGTASASEDELVEIVNLTDVNMDLAGCTLSDATGVRHTFPASTVVPAGGSLVVFGGGAPAARFGGARWQVASTGQLALADAGDTVTLRNPTGGVIDTMTYAAEGGMDDALVRDPDYSGPFVRHSTVTPGRRFSPGTTVDGYGF